MVELTASGVQTVKPGGVVLFTEAVQVNNRNVMHREGSGTVTLRNDGCGCRYNRGTRAAVVTFGANVTFPTAAPAGETAATTPVSLALAIGGEPDTSTEMVVTPSAADELFSVSRTAVVTVPRGCCTQVAVENTSNGTITVENASLIID